MNLEALKEKARRHEQKEEWKKALDAYRQVLDRQDADEPPDITLFNRIGDIQTRLGQLDPAVECYEKAVDLYLEAELPNNAIAICKKVLRNLPDRNIFFLRMGQIRGAQGFLTDAKQAFLTYAERRTAIGDLDSALDALIELVALVPDDVEIRMGLASQLEAHSRVEEAVSQYTDTYRHLLLQDRMEEAEALSGKIEELAPGAVLPDLNSVQASAATAVQDGEPQEDQGFRGFELGSGVAPLEPIVPGEVEFLDVPAGEGAEALEEGVEPPAAVEPAGIAIGDVFADDAEEEEPEPLPELSFDDREEGDQDRDALPTFGLGGGEEDEVHFGASSDGPEDGEINPKVLSSFGEEEGEEADDLPQFGVDEDDLAEAVPAFGEMNQAEAAEALSVLDAVDPTEDEDDEGEEEIASLPLLGASEGEGGESGAETAIRDAVEEAAFESRREETAEGEAPSGEPAPLSAHAQAAERGDLDLAIELVRVEIESMPEEVDLYQRQVEYAFRKADDQALVTAYLDLAKNLLRAGSPKKARAVFQQVLSLSPGEADAISGMQEIDGEGSHTPPAQVASSEEYVDLGSMILGEETEKTTRWQVTADSPSGDDQADFAKMLNQFKEKVSENVDADDVSAHHDLGTAYLEMGLLDEAISEFQMALRASPDHLPTHEVMGRCWMEKGQPDMAVRALNRALGAKYEVEDELIGIYYIMGLAKEELGVVEDAVEFFEKVFSLDINFKDVTERLRALR